MNKTGRPFGHQPASRDDVYRIEAILEQILVEMKNLNEHLLRMRK